MLKVIERVLRFSLVVFVGQVMMTAALLLLAPREAAAGAYDCVEQQCLSYNCCRYASDQKCHCGDCDSSKDC